MVQKVIRSRREHLTHQEARQLISAYGIQTLETAYCDDEDDAVEVFREWGGPVNVTLLHEAGCHPFLEETTGRGRYKATIRRLNDEQGLPTPVGCCFSSIASISRTVGSWALPSIRRMHDLEG